MMFKIKNTISNVKSFLFKDKNGIIIDKNSNLYYNKSLISQNVDSTNFNFIDGRLIYTANENTFIDDKQIDAIGYIKCEMGSNEILLSSNFTIDYPDFKMDYTFYDIHHRKSVFLGNFKNLFTIFIHNNHLVFYDKIKISALQVLVNTSNTLWHFDLSQFGQWKNFEDQDRNYEVEQFVGVSGSCLYVLLSNFKLIALHIETGELLHQLNLGELFALEPRNWLSYSSKMHLDEVNNRIIWLTSATLLHIDLTDFNAKLIKDFFNVPIENLWRFKCSNYQDQKLLFTAQYGREGGDPDIVGIMNPDTGDILWQYQIPNTQGLYEAPQLTNNQLYVRSLDNNLYVFEKE